MKTWLWFWDQHLYHNITQIKILLLHDVMNAYWHSRIIYSCNFVNSWIKICIQVINLRRRKTQIAFRIDLWLKIKLKSSFIKY